MTVYWQHNTVRLTGAFTNQSGTPTDADVARLTVRAPDGVDSIWLYPGTATKTGTGAYAVDVDYNQAGDWRWWWEFEMSSAIVASSAVTLDRVLPLPDVARTGN